MKTKLLMLGCLFLSCITALLAGCGPVLSDQRDLTIAANEILAIPIDPISQQQTIKVTASSPGSPIDVHIFLQEHEAAIERKITLGKPPENLLASQNDAEQVSLEATVPANKEVIVRLQSASAKTANVHLEISN